MSTWFVDPVNGINSNASVGNGDSFSTRRKSLSNIVAAVLLPADEIRVMKSADPTSLGVTGAWTNGPLRAAFVPTSSTNATPIVFTKVGHGLVTGDTVIVNGHTVNTNANGVWNVTVSGNTFTLLNSDGSNSVGNGVGGATGTIRKITNSVVTLASSLTANIACIGNRNALTNWTASANVTCSINPTDYKEGGECLQIVIATGFTTGLAAYLARSLNLSSYQQISFWIKQTSGIIGADNSISFALCTDTAGATVVHTINIPNLATLNRWTPITIDLGTNLNSAIQSIAFYVNTDNAAQTYLIDNIIACKAASLADSLTHQSMVGKNTGMEGWYCLQSINGTRLILDQDTNCKPTTAPSLGYYGVTETVTIYKLETTKTPLATNVASILNEVLDSGTSESVITISGGWNTTDMSTQTGETYLDGLNCQGICIFLSSKNFVNIDKINCYRYDRSLYLNSSSNITITMDGGNNFTGMALITGHNNTINSTNVNNSSFVSYGFYIIAGCGNNINAANINNSNTGVLLLNCNGNTFTLQSRNNSYAISSSLSTNNKAVIDTLDSSVRDINIDAGDLYLNNSTLGSNVKVGGNTAYANASVWSTNENNNTDTHYGYLDGGLVAYDPGNSKWSVSPTSTNRSATYPLKLKVMTAKVAANTPITVSVRFNRTNTGLTVNLVCYGGQLSGVSDTSSSMTAAADIDQIVSVTVTPTEKGVLEFYVECYGGTTYSVYVDNILVS